jgi:hypothetical protein
MIFETLKFLLAFPIHPDTDLSVEGICPDVWMSGSQRLIPTSGHPLLQTKNIKKKTYKSSLRPLPLPDIQTSGHRVRGT